ncbi:hypothetical protein BBJ29_009986 [Phytophthora kernoviae]|uniref:START domain-containing protein n=1 Tax=Phytophthora kernoviae TaxID=325452 RepID=A0A421FUY1_9STRA|nr:hypothetical protein BBJ29_009986 [Phytophthora kernoviae]
MLRKMVDLQIEEARNLRRILKRRTKIQVMEKQLGERSQQTPVLPKAMPATFQDNSHIFGQILRDVEQTYADVDTLIKEMDIYSIPCPGRNRRATNSTVNGMCLELKERFMVPFSIEMTAKAFWEMQCVDDYRVDIQCQVQNSEQGVDTAVVDFNATYSVSDFIWRSKVRKVVRKYVKNNATMLIYRTFVDPKRSGMNEPIGVF